MPSYMTICRTAGECRNVQLEDRRMSWKSNSTCDFLALALSNSFLGRLVNDVVLQASDRQHLQAGDLGVVAHVLLRFEGAATMVRIASPLALCAAMWYVSFMQSLYSRRTEMSSGLMPLAELHIHRARTTALPILCVATHKLIERIAPSLL
eukprot:CAMPEP_0119356460 /NCGR_PEP_ID=MMETSP1334-20130426/5061_1 /TAXON_ID=127549 /ORGANISM="Calcidiscus leptoporus, Strain RCC1130" /LENGTH=150 /DNA_ID=CAMNT_0007370493 /DNA_START=206 /DNA_END=656 /DNA_ORIENTATION=+